MGKKLLFISPHPDDSEFGCGGLIAKASTRGDECHIAVLMKGDIQMLHSGELASFERRKMEQQNASSVLGVAETHYLCVGEVGSIKADAQSIAQMDRLLMAGYDAVYSPQPSFNQDHRAAWEIVHAAFRPGRKSIETTSLFMYDIPHDCANTHGLFGGVAGKVYSPMSTEHLQKKIEALYCHQTQMRGRPSSMTSEKAVTVLAAQRGMECGFDYAELFYLVRGVSL